ncbi:DUF2785 domain-containing protein [Flexivirga alba]|uniref:DUF2785 domain-containing protein n=1 Tax=Flexivirga alba TaxID=702742 RepID=A0ABW2AEP4_9MICO
MEQSQLDQLVTDLASADPAIRDEGAYGGLVKALTEHALTVEQRRELGGCMVERLRDPEPYARSFGSLIFAVLASTWTTDDGEWPAAWTDSLLAWWSAETDLRGYVEPVGWIHAVAHGADAVGELGATGLAPAPRLLTAIAERLTIATDFVWRDQEDDRVAAAICAVLLGDATADLGLLLGPISAMFEAGEHGPVPPAASNAMHTLRSLYVALGNELVHPETGEPARIPDNGRLQHAIAATLAPTTPWLFSAAGGSAD